MNYFNNVVQILRNKNKDVIKYETYEYNFFIIVKNLNNLLNI